MLKTVKRSKNLNIKYAGTGNYNFTFKAVKITVNKEKTTIASKRKTFKKSKKVKKYTIKLKNSKAKRLRMLKSTFKSGTKFIILKPAVKVIQL